MADKPFEIPAAVREMTERNVAQAKVAYGQFVDIAKQAQDQMTRSTDAVAANARDVQSKAMRYAQAQIDANFAFVSDLAKARDLREIIEVQTKYAQAQAQSFTNQAQDLAKMMTDLGDKARKK